jgi:hypothetical protein
MTAPIKLIPLKCVRCETPVPAQPDEVAWMCAQCGQGLLLDEERGLAALKVHFAAGSTTKGQGNPYWVTDGLVTLQRETYSTFGKKAEEARQFWSQPRRFFIPAFTCPLDLLISLGTGLLLRPPELQPATPIPFTPVTLHPQDVSALIDFIVVAIEAERTDKVKQVRFSTQLGSPSLWILPS